MLFCHRVKLATQRIGLQLIRLNSTNAATNMRPEVSGLFQYTQLTNKSYLKIRGPDTIKFLNGMITSKLQPHFVKKNLMTINDKDTSQANGTSIINFPLDKSNWGIYQEEGPHGEYISRFAQYTGFLNGKGKLVTDSILYCTPILNGLNLKYPEFLLEFDSKMVPYMLKDFESHKLGSKIKFESVEGLKCWDIMIAFENIPVNVENPWINNLLDPMSSIRTPEDAQLFSENVLKSLFMKNDEESPILGCFVDRRFDTLIYGRGNIPEHFRIVTKDSCKDISEHFNTDMMPFPFKVKKHEDNSVIFRRERLKYGFLDGIEDVKPTTVLPLECNFDHIPNAINSNKGCYVGQELTARTISTGILRKRIVSVKIDEPELLKEMVSLEQEDADGYFDVELNEKYSETSGNDKTMAPNPFAKGNAEDTSSSKTNIRRKKKPVGTLLAREGDVGVVLLRTEYFPLAFEKHVDSGDKFYISTPSGKRIHLVPERPLWYDEWRKSQVRR